MKNKFIGLAVVFIMLGFLSLILGCGKEKKTEYPFDTEKAYCMKRGGVIAGGEYIIETDPEDIVEVYSYPVPVPKKEGGMRDKGAKVFFVGIYPGEVTVTVSEHYPGGKPEESSFVLFVDENLRVFKKEAE